MSTLQNTLLSHLRSLAAKQASGAMPDQQLLEQFRTQRSETAFAALVRRHGPMVWSVCRRVLGNHHDAEDAFQAVFLVFVHQAASIRKQESVSGFLHSIAYRIATKSKVAAAHRLARERTQARPPFEEPCDDLTWRELRSVLDEEMTKLPEQYRAPLVLCYLEGKTQDEAARLLGWSKNTFRRRLEKARATLARRLTRRGITLSAALSAPLLIDATVQAALPPLLAANTVRAGLAAAMGNTASGMVSAYIIALAESGTASLLPKKASLALILLISLMLGAGGLLAHRVAHSRSFAEAPSAPPVSTPPSGRSASKDQIIEINGRVLDPDGKAVAGAKVYVSTYSYKDKSDPKIRAETDGGGRFHFRASRAEVDCEEMLAAIAPGYGPDWLSLKEAGNNKELTLRLVKDDVPIEGRVLDLEGHPIAGASVRVLSVQKMPGEDLTPWLKEVQTKPYDAYNVGWKYQRILLPIWGILGSPKFVTTDANGRFRLGGFGRERLVNLRFEGPSIEYGNLTVISRPGAIKDLPKDMRGAQFDYVAAPGKRIRGTVREKGSGKPVAGARVTCGPSAGQTSLTDKEGHYEIPGLGKAEQYNLGVGGGRIIFHFKRVGDTPGLQPITADFEVECGLVLRVRATEKGTGKAVRGRVWYSAAADNPNLKNYTTYPTNIFGRDSTEKDGTLNQVVLPGRGFVAFLAEEDRFIRPSIKGQNIHAATGFVPLATSHVVVPIEPSADDPKSLVCEIVLDPGLEVSGAVVGPDDRPLSGVKAAGLGSVYPVFREPELPDNRFTVRGLEAGKPRTVVFWHESKGLARAAVIRGEAKVPPSVRLEPRGAVAGQVVDAKGRPLRGIGVIPQLSEKQAAPLAYFRSQIGESSLPKAALPAHVLTDEEGRFRIDGFVSGLNYSLELREQSKQIAQKELTIKSGATVDVGAIKTKKGAETPER